MRIGKITISSTILTLKGGIEKSLFSEMFSLLPDDAKICGIDRASGMQASYIFISSSEFKELPAGSSADAVPDIIIHFKKDGYEDAYVEKVDMTEVIDRNVSIHPYTKYGMKASTPPPAPPQAIPVAQKTCYYPRWKKYVGIMDSFEYCEDCGKKKGEHL